MFMKPIRQGDVLLIPEQSEVQGEILPHLTLAFGEATSHSHRISEGKAQLIDRNGQWYLAVESMTATLLHEEHAAIEIPKGLWAVKIQREYTPEGWTYVAD